MRDNEWLISRLYSVWSCWFNDVERRNKVIARFKGKWKNKFGHIKMKNDITEIAVNGLFKNPEVPDEIIDLTLAHEIIHYMHGFQSPLEKKFRYPHKGGIVRKELISRGLRDSLKREKDFIKDWFKVYSRLTGEKIDFNREPRIKVRHFSSFFGI